MAKTNGMTKLIIGIIGAGATLAVAVYGYGYLNSQVDTQKTTLTSHCTEDKSRDEQAVLRIRAVEDASIRTEKDISQIRSDVTAQKAMLEKISDKILSKDYPR